MKEIFTLLKQLYFLNSNLNLGIPNLTIVQFSLNIYNSSNPWEKKSKCRWNQRSFVDKFLSHQNTSHRQNKPYYEIKIKKRE